MAVKIAVISDTHGERNMLAGAIRESHPVDIIIHCGDGVQDICAADIPENTVVLMVKGNTDISPHCDVDEIIFENILEQNIMITHGHQFDVKSGLKRISTVAMNAGAGLVIFGHTHKQFFKDGNPRLFNPGNLSGGNYGIIHASDGRWVFEHKKMMKR